MGDIQCKDKLTVFTHSYYSTHDVSIDDNNSKFYFHYLHEILLGIGAKCIHILREPNWLPLVLEFPKDPNDDFL